MSVHSPAGIRYEAQGDADNHANSVAAKLTPRDMRIVHDRREDVATLAVRAERVASLPPSSKPAKPGIPDIQGGRVEGICGRAAARLRRGSGREGHGGGGHRQGDERSDTTVFAVGMPQRSRTAARDHTRHVRRPRHCARPAGGVDDVNTAGPR